MHTQEEINESWTESSKNYSWIIDNEIESFRKEKWQKKILGQIDREAENLQVLDTGCGPGFFSIILSMKKCSVTGIDGSEGMLREAREKASRYGVTPRFMEMDCHELKFEDNQFDLIVSRNVTHALRNHKQVYSEWLRVLKPGGVLLIFDANWHLPICDPKLREESIRRFQACTEKYGDAFNKYTENKDEHFEEEITEEHLLGDQIRPDWDMGLLQGVGFSDITCERNIIDEMWDEKEILLYGHTPMFMIRAVKARESL